VLSGAGEYAAGPAGAHDAAPATSRTWTHAAWASLVVAAAVLAPLTVKWFAGSGPDPVVSRFELALPAGVVLFSADADNVDRLQQVADSGGTPAVVTPLALPKIVIQRWPHFLSDGRHFLFFASARQAETDGVYVGSLDAAGSTRLVAGFTEARYSDGVLFFVRDTTLMAQPFDAERRAFGAADPVVVSSVSGGGNEGAKAFSVSDTGVLVTVPPALAPKNQLKWFDRSGRWIADLGAPASQRGVRISPDGLRVVTSNSAPATSPTSGGALWTTDAKSGRSQRLTFIEGVYVLPVWSPDANVVFFRMGTQATGISDVFRQPTNGGASQESLLADRVHKRPQDVSPDGRYLLYAAGPTPSTSELPMLSLADRKSSPYRRSWIQDRPSQTTTSRATAGFCSTCPSRARRRQRLSR
jgi:eukaryotic-like serine/threonine-protein kinase